MKPIKIAVVQLCSSDNPYENLCRVNDFVMEAHRLGAVLVCFPENVFYRGPKKKPNFDRSELFLSLDVKHKLIENSPFSRALLEFAQTWPVAVSLGSVLELREDPEMPYNAHFFVHPFAQKIYSYRKVHLFRFQGTEAFYEESRDIHPGSHTLSVDWAGLRLGLSICFDLRFPELYRQLAIGDKAHVLLVPAAFASETGQAHWHTLLRARAIENQAYVVAAAQWGSHLDSRMQECSCYGHALAYGPWGETLVELPALGDHLAILNVDLDAQNRLRTRLPALDSVKLWKS